jgi:hypothetical protein
MEDTIVRKKKRIEIDLSNTKSSSPWKWNSLRHVYPRDTTRNGGWKQNWDLSYEGSCFRNCNIRLPIFLLAYRESTQNVMLPTPWPVVRKSPQQEADNCSTHTS